jgi:hypothetical protein
MDLHIAVHRGHATREGRHRVWFETLMGFPEVSPQQVRAQITLDGATLHSQVNGKVWVCGTLETPSLAELRAQVQACGVPGGHLGVREVVADVQDLHANPEHAGALFQVASQFNLLEMASPHVTPEQGVGIYAHDRTQGPACAVAAGAGTIYRNYFAPVQGHIGQSVDHQIDCLAGLGVALDNTAQRLWTMQNGYALATHSGLTEIAQRLHAASAGERDALRQLLRIGIQWQTQVTLRDATHLVSQAYCSALPVAYTPHAVRLWAPFAQLILEAAYEATLCAALVNARRHGNNRVFLTLLGGGAFGNDIAWIIAAIQRAVHLYQEADLDVVLVSYGSPTPALQPLLHRTHHGTL